MVKNLMRLSLNSEVCKVKLHESSSTEVQVMTAIIIVMKLVFSLDGCTEYKLSHTASEINRWAFKTLLCDYIINYPFYKL